MAYQIEVMTQEEAEEIAFNWHYDGEYSFYDMAADKEDLEEFINPEKRGSNVFSVIDTEELIGYFTASKEKEYIIDIGLGLRPDLTGKGIGLHFLKTVMEFVNSEYKPKKITLSVAFFNQRAVKVYRKIGFTESHIYWQKTNGSTFKFLKMEYDC